MKLSKPQQKVINLMSAGWALGAEFGLNTRCWLQQDGLGRGGETEDVRSDTFHSLYKNGLIEKVKSGFPASTYGLTEFGKENARNMDFVNRIKEQNARDIRKGRMEEF